MRRSNKPLVRNDLLLTNSTDSSASDPVRVGSQAWFALLADIHTFIYKGNTGHFTARRETRRNSTYWYGYRRLDGKLSKTYLGKSEDLTWECLEQASARLAGQTPLTRNSSEIDSLSLVAAPTKEKAETDLSFLPLTKVTPPALPRRLIARSRLTQRISAPVNLICAPSGFGKTTLLNEWRQSCGMPVAWVALDADDNHPLRFWSAVVTALQRVNSGVGQSWLSQLRPSSPSTLSRLVINLTNDIVQVTEAPNVSQRIGLVFDDYHHIQHPEIHASLQNWLDQFPPTLQLAIASHARPPLSFGHLRSKGMVVELVPDDLRFTLEEGIEFLWQHAPEQNLAHSDMETLVKRTEGWVTGLVLATNALTQHDDRSRFIETFTGAHTFLREFFMERVLHRQPPEVQTFLHKTSILRHLTGPLCDAVTGQSDGTEMLARLWEENVFLVRLEEPDWYRYHDLFAEMLRTQLQEQFPAKIPHLHRRAAEWHRTQNAPADAVYHLMVSESWKEAAALIESMALHELERLGEESRLLGWLRQLPEAVVEQHKTLLGVYIRLARIALPPAEVENILTSMERDISETAEMDKTDSAQEALTELQRMRRLWVANDHQTPGIPAGGEHETVWQMLDGILQYRRDCRHNLIQAEERAKAVYETALARRHLYAILVAGGGCANLALSQGHLRRSEEIAQQVLRQALDLRGELPGSANITLTALSNVYFMRNQIEQAHQLLERATEVDPNPTSTNELVTIAILRAKIQSAQGDNKAAFATIHAIRELHAQRPSSIWRDEDLISYQELFRLRQGDLAAAERHLNEGVDIETNAFSALVRAEILIEQKRRVAAEDILNHLLAQYPHGFYMLPILKARVILAIALFEQRKVYQARQVMTEAARLAAPEYFIRPFLDYGSKIAPLFSLILRTENLGAGTQSFLKGVLSMLGHTNNMLKIHSREESMELAMAASITPREQEVLHELSNGLSNRQIAERLSISTSTVKTHIENIFRKLGANSRTQAVAQAKNLGLM